VRVSLGQAPAGACLPRRTGSSCERGAATAVPAASF
jgi:hypothetical protein